MKKEITIDGVVYIPKDEKHTCICKAASVEGMPYVIVRTYSAGVFAGYLKEKNGQNAKMVNARRLWYWAGASSLSQLSVDGVNKPDECKFPCEVPNVELDQVIEVLGVSEKAKLSINAVPIWKQ